MQKPKRTIVMLLICLIALGFSQRVEAQTPFTVLQDEVLLDIPAGLVFKLRASAAAKIERVRLRYGTNARTCTLSSSEIEPDFTPGIETEAEWKLEFKRSGVLPPGARLWWEWEIQDENGNQFTTTRQEMVLSDPRHDWRTLTSGMLQLQWFEQSEATARKLLGYAETGLARLAQETGVVPSESILLTVYPDYESLQELLVSSTEWTGGVAFSEYNSILLGVPQDALEWARTAIPHELVHLLVGERTFNCQGISLPLWLNEGMAVHNEGALDRQRQQVVLDALDRSALPSLSSLSNAFSPFPEEANRAYTQSAMLVGYLIETYGASSMERLLTFVQSGSTIDEALVQVYSLDTLGIDSAWRQSLGFQGLSAQNTTPKQRTPIPTLALYTPAAKASTQTPTSTTTPTSEIAQLPAPTDEPLPSPTPMPTLTPTATQPAPLTAEREMVAGFMVFPALVVVIVLLAAWWFSHHKRLPGG